MAARDEEGDRAGGAGEGAGGERGVGRIREGEVSRDEGAEAAQRQAVALQYRRGKDVAPKVTAAGKGRIAENILKRAREAGVPLLEDPDLVNLLGKIPVGDTIPADLYKAVAEVLAYVYRVNQGYRG
ncbi:MAG: EscU/YscU/HrcU family type III secretion system export apparatus switch protein [Magnetococcales bacterium]|nr:EscU/YscU/HrcU family type III secretion system export apparatus switch protein [Magnetococcales bacterium]